MLHVTRSNMRCMLPVASQVRTASHGLLRTMAAQCTDSSALVAAVDELKKATVAAGVSVNDRQARAQCSGMYVTFWMFCGPENDREALSPIHPSIHPSAHPIRPSIDPFIDPSIPPLIPSRPSSQHPPIAPAPPTEGRTEVSTRLCFGCADVW